MTIAAKIAGTVLVLCPAQIPFLAAANIKFNLPWTRYYAAALLGIFALILVTLVLRTIWSDK